MEDVWQALLIATRAAGTKFRILQVEGFFMLLESPVARSSRFQKMFASSSCVAGQVTVAEAATKLYD